MIYLRLHSHQMLMEVRLRYQSAWQAESGARKCSGSGFARSDAKPFACNFSFLRRISPSIRFHDAQFFEVLSSSSKRTEMEPESPAGANFASSSAVKKPKIVIKMGICSWTDKTFDGTFYPLKNTKTSGTDFVFLLPGVYFSSHFGIAISIRASLKFLFVFRCFVCADKVWFFFSRKASCLAFGCRVSILTDSSILYF